MIGFFIRCVFLSFIIRILIIQLLLFIVGTKIYISLLILNFFIRRTEKKFFCLKICLLLNISLLLINIRNMNLIIKTVCRENMTDHWHTILCMSSSIRLCLRYLLIIWGLLWGGWRIGARVLLLYLRLATDLHYFF
jgi:hypothetical protein